MELRKCSGLGDVRNIEAETTEKFRVFQGLSLMAATLITICKAFVNGNLSQNFGNGEKAQHLEAKQELE